MALDQSALLEVLDALKVADVGDRIRQAAETIYQALIEAELTETIGAARHERSDTRTNWRHGHRPTTPPTCATATVHARCRPRPGIWSCGSRSCAPARSSPACSSGAAGWTR